MSAPQADGTNESEPPAGDGAALLLGAAIAYATAGFAVLPLHSVTAKVCTCGDETCPSSGKHPRLWNGLTGASSDPATVGAWWQRWPYANIGLRTGDGRVVLDVDTAKGGAGTLAELERQHGKLPKTAEVLTGGGGRHIWFSHGGSEVRNSAGRLGPGLDVRADGGYVVAPPSRHATGRRYLWTRPLERGIAAVPAWLVEDATARRNGPAAPVADEIPQGERNGALASLAGSMRRRGRSEAEILAALRETNRLRCRPPLDERELEKIARSIASYPPASREKGESDRGLDDIGNAARFVDQHLHALRHVPVWDRWLCWDGARLTEDDVLEHRRRAKDTARALADEAAGEPDDQRRKDLLAHAKRSASEPRLRAMLMIAASDPCLVVRPAELDSDPWALNTPSGVVDLRTGELRPHRLADHLTMLAGAGYDPNATASLWQAHLRRCLVSGEMISFLQRLAGLSAIGTVLEHILPIFCGPGGNGKSVTRNAIAGALGDYAAQSTIDLLLQTGRSPGQATPELADLRGRRLVTVGETPEDGRLASERVKAITGGEPITARRLHSNPFTFSPSHTVWLLTNHRPRIPDDSAAAWRRIVLIPFVVTIPDVDQDKELGTKLAADRAGILTWIVDGARAYLREGLNPPQAVKTATSSYREAEDLLSAFLAERTITEDDASVQASALLRAYNTWADQAGGPHLSANALADKLHARNYERKRQRAGSRWHGLRLVQEDTLDV